MNILITNDDGINSPGLLVLRNILQKFGNVTIVAPDKQQSAVSSLLSINKPLRVHKVYKEDKFFGYSVDGSPVDCVKLAVTTLLEHKPDLIISGINHGKNTSINILYSGTVAAAFEGLLYNIPSIAFSICSHALNVDFTAAEHFINELIPQVIDLQEKENLLLNVNIPVLPSEEIKGFKVTKPSSTLWDDKYEKRTDPFGYDYYWFSGSFIPVDKNEDTDENAIANGYISITPLKIDFFNQDLVNHLNIK